MLLTRTTALWRVPTNSALISVRKLSGSIKAEEFNDFIVNKAKVSAPQRMEALLEVLPEIGYDIVRPTDRKGLNPLLIPIAANRADATKLCFLRWPTQKEGVEMQLVRTNEVGVSLVSISTDHFCRRQAVELDFLEHKSAGRVANAVNRAGNLYNSGDIAAYMKTSKFPVQTPDEKRIALDRYLLTKVGPFPDCYSRLAENFLAKNNDISALVTCERSMNLFYSWGQPILFHAQLLKRLGREREAQDTVKTALSMPKWTLAHNRKDLDEAIALAGYTDSKVLAEMHAFRSTDPRTKDIEEGVSPEQVLLDQAAHLMDAVALGSKLGGWEDTKAEIARRYREGGYPDIAAFIEA